MNNKLIGNDGKTILSKVPSCIFIQITEEFKSGNFNKKISLYDSLVHDEYINRYADKNNSDNWKKITNFMTRNEDFKGKKQIKLQGKSESIRQEILKNCHGPNNKVLTKQDIRTPSEFMNDQKNYLSKKVKNLNDLKNSQIQKEEQNTRKTPSVTFVNRL